LLLLLVLAVLAYGIYYTVKSQVDFVREDIPVYAIPVYEKTLIWTERSKWPFIRQIGTSLEGVLPYELNGKPHFITIEVEYLDSIPAARLKLSIYNLTGGLVKEYVLEEKQFSSKTFYVLLDAVGYSIGNVSVISLPRVDYQEYYENPYRVNVETKAYTILLKEGEIVKIDRLNPPQYYSELKQYFVDKEGNIKYTLRSIPVIGQYGDLILEIYEGDMETKIYERRVSLGSPRVYVHFPIIFETKRYIYYLMYYGIYDGSRVTADVIYVFAFNKETGEMSVLLEDVRDTEYVGETERFAVSYDSDALYIAKRILIIGNKAYYIGGERYYLLAGVLHKGLLFYSIEGDYQFYEIHSMQKRDGTITTTREAIGRIYYYEDVGERHKLVCTAPDGTVNVYYGRMLSRIEEFWNLKILGLEIKNPISLVLTRYEKLAGCDNPVAEKTCIQDAIVIYDLENKKFSYSPIFTGCFERTTNQYKYPERIIDIWMEKNIEYFIPTTEATVKYDEDMIEIKRRVRVLTIYPTIEALEQKYKTEQPTYQPPTYQPPTYQPPIQEQPTQQPTPQPTPGVQTVIEYVYRQPLLVIAIIILVIAILLATIRK
ncbi:MAG: hypothetical protein QXI77_02635, partial [Nanopusillaceae archaeon]